MRWMTIFLTCSVGVAFVLPGTTQETRDKIQLQTVKYPGLADVIHANAGKVVLVDFWAFYCVPCKKGLPDVVDMHKKYATDGLAVISVALDPPEDSTGRENALVFLKKVEAEFTNLYLDEPPELWQKKLGFLGPPCYFVFNRQGKWTKFEPKDDEPIHDTIEKFVAARLREK